MTFKLESMSDEVLKSVAKSTNKTMADKAKTILAKRICVVEQPGKRTGLPKLNSTMKTRKATSATNAGKGAVVLPYATPPGDTLRETLKEKGISQMLLAETMGRPIKTINEIIHAKARITEHTALELEHALNIPANVWMALETNYRIAIARGKDK